MFNIHETGNLIIFAISSERRMIRNIVHKSREFLKKYDFEKFNIASFAHSKFVIHELLTNAVIHGNDNNHEAVVTCSLEYLGDCRFKIVVEDQGCGFDYKSKAVSIPHKADKIHNSGYEAINTYTEKVGFNDKGNCITAYINLNTETR